MEGEECPGGWGGIRSGLLGMAMGIRDCLRFLRGGFGGGIFSLSFVVSLPSLLIFSSLISSLSPAAAVEECVAITSLASLCSKISSFAKFVTLTYVVFSVEVTAFVLLPDLL